jgi:DNA-binding transcriptional regulator GbsR (MarR family)
MNHPGFTSVFFELSQITENSRDNPDHTLIQNKHGQARSGAAHAKKDLRMNTMSPLVRSFVAHFGEMGSRWGINRTVGQIYALIFMSPRPIHADDIAEALEFSRSNVSMGLKELQSWRLVRMKHIPGDRREYFDAPSDAWEIFRTLAEERRRREIEPTLTMLRNALLEAPSSDDDKVAQERMQGMHDLIEMMMTWFDDVQRMDAKTLSQLMKLGAKVGKLLEFTGQLKVVGSSRDKE